MPTYTAEGDEDFLVVVVVCDDDVGPMQHLLMCGFKFALQNFRKIKK